MLSCMKLRVILIFTNGTAQVLAFRGTSDAKDIVADGVLGLGSNPQQGIDAENNHA